MVKRPPQQSSSSNYENRRRFYVLKNHHALHGTKSLKQIVGEAFKDSTITYNTINVALSSDSPMPAKHAWKLADYFGVSRDIFSVDNAQFNRLIARAFGEIEEKEVSSSAVLDFGPTIDRHRFFVGRERLISRISKKRAKSNVIFILGEPGIGKTALMANLLKHVEGQQRKNIVDHFFERGAFSSTTIGFLRNICAKLGQLTESSASHTAVSIDELRTDFGKLLSENEQDGTQTYFIIDALDEAETPSQILESLPSSIPPEYVFVISSRPGVHLDRWRGLVDIVEMRANSTTNQKDCLRFVQSRFPRFSKRVSDLLFKTSSGNFLILKLIADDIESHKMSESEIEKRFGSLAEISYSSLQTFYEAYWSLIRERCLEQSENHLNDVLEILGVLSTCFEAIDRKLLQEFLDDSWTTAKFERAVSSIVQFLRIETDQAILGKQRYGIYHATFRDFIMERLSFDLGGIHDRIAGKCINELEQFSPEGRAETYFARYSLRHAVASENHQHLEILLSRKNLDTIRRHWDSVAPIIQELESALKHMGPKFGLDVLLQVSSIRVFFLSQRQHPLFGTELFLNARMDPTFPSLREAVTLTDPNDRLLLLTSAFETASPLNRSEIMLRIEDLIPHCTAEVVETCADYVADADLEAATNMAMCIPRPDSGLEGAIRNIELPTPTRAIFRFFMRQATINIDRARDAAASLPHKSAKLIALISCGLSQTTIMPCISSELLNNAINILHKDARSTVTGGIKSYLARQIVNVDIEDVSKVLTVIIQTVPNAIFDENVRWGLQDRMDANPGFFHKLQQGKPVSDGEKILFWLSQRTGLENCEDSGILDTQMGDLLDVMKTVDRAYDDPLSVAQYLDSGIYPNLAGRLVAELACRMESNEVQSGANLIAMAAKDIDLATQKTYFSAALELLGAEVPLSTDTMGQIVNCAVSHVVKEEIAPLKADRLWLVAYLVGQWFAKTQIDKRPITWSSVLECFATEQTRFFFASAIVEHSSVEIAAEIIEDPSAYCLEPHRGEHWVQLLLPDSRARIMALAGFCVGRAQQNLSRNAFSMAFELASTIEHSANRRSVERDILTAVIKISPMLGWELFLSNDLEISDFRRCLDRAFRQIGNGPKEDAEKRLRYGIEIGLTLDSFYTTGKEGVDSRLEFADIQARTYYATLAQHEIPDEFLQTWCEELVITLQKFAAKIGTNVSQYHFFNVYELAERLAKGSWTSFEALATDRNFQTKDLSNPFLYFRNKSDHVLALFQCQALRTAKPFSYLRTIRDIQRISENPSNSENMHDIEGVVLAAAISYDSRLAISLLSTAPTCPNKNIASWITHFELKSSWTEKDIQKVWELMSKKGEIEYATEVISHLVDSPLPISKLSDELAQGILQDILNESFGIDERWAATAHFASLFDSFNLVSSLLDYDELPSTPVYYLQLAGLEGKNRLPKKVRREMLLSASKIAEAHQDNKRLGEIAVQIMEISFSDAFRVFHTIDPTSDEWSGNLTKFVEAAVNLGKQNYPDVIDQLRSSSKEQASELTSTYIIASAKSGFDIPEDDFNCLASGIDRLEVSMATGRTSVNSEVSGFAKHESIATADKSGSELIEIHRRIAKVTSTQSQSLAYEHYLRAATQITKEPHPIVFWFTLSAICGEASDHLNEEKFGEYIREALEIALAYKPQIDLPALNYSEALTPLLCVIGRLSWSSNRTVAEMALNAAKESIMENERTGIYALALLGSKSDLLNRDHSDPHAATRYFLRLFSKNKKQEVADALLNQCIDPNLFQSYQYLKPPTQDERLNDREQQLTEWLLPYCSPETQVAGYLAIAWANWHYDRTLSRIAAESAKRVVLDFGIENKNRLQQMNIVLAATHGRTAVRDILKDGNDDIEWHKEGIPLICYFSLLHSDDRIGEIKEIWKFCRSVREFRTSS